jgi:hypothetical protein
MADRIETIKEQIEACLNNVSRQSESMEVAAFRDGLARGLRGEQQAPDVPTGP